MNRRFSTEVKDWLTKTKGIDEKLAEGVIAAFPRGKASLNDIKGLGDSGLKQLISAVQRQQAMNQSKRETIDVHISVPHERHSFTVKAPIGGTFQTLAEENDDVRQYLECVCGGNAACSTCHVIVDADYYGRLPPAEENEYDMLDLAAELSETSRLGCQIVFTKDLEGLTVQVPAEFNNLFGTSGGTSM